MLPFLEDRFSGRGMVLVPPEGLFESRRMDAFFAELGRTVAARWKAENFALAAFPEIARAALDEQLPSENVDLSEFVRGFLLDDEQAFQTSSGFGQPEVIVYDDPRFYIQILVWLEGTTDIHQHEFSGAFHVLAGSSIHAHFEFLNPCPVSAHLRVGELRMKDIRLLEAGATVPIISGGSCIHSLFHLDMPSISVVIRTHHDPGTGPQFTYLPPHIAVDPNHHDALTTRRKQLLDVLERTDDPTYADLVLEMLGGLDFERGFFILQNCMGHLKSLEAWEEALAVFQHKHGALADGVAPTLNEIVRRDGIAAFRSSITEAGHRFFLALLNVPTRAEFLGLVAQRYPGEETETILRWVEELTEVSDFGTSILDAEFPSEVDVAEEEQPEVFLEALRYFLEGREAADAPKPLSPADLEILRGVFERSSLRALIS